MKKRNKPGPKPIDPKKRFQNFVDKDGKQVEGVEGQCHEWNGCYDRCGYPVFGISPDNAVKAYRYAYEMRTGKKLKKHEQVKRICDNPRCVNGKHVRRK